MAGDWIKLQVNIWTNPKIVRIMSALKRTKVHTVGAVCHAWCVADQHADENGRINMTEDEFNLLCDEDNLASAMASVGWLTIGDGFLQFPDYQEHNGSTAKRRAGDQKRKRSMRTNVRTDADTMRTREEKRREENKETKKERPPNDDYANRVKDWWNTKIAKMGFSSVRGMTKARTAKAKARHVLDHSEEIERALRRAGTFLRGGKWFSLDWLVKNEENMLKLLEGKYEAEKDELEAYTMTDGQIRLAMSIEEEAAEVEEQGEIF